MASIDVAIDWITHVSSVDGCSEVIVEAKTVNAFTKAVEVVVLGQDVDEFNELVFVNKVGALGGEDNISGRLAGYGKPERWIIAPIECETEVLM